MNTRQLGIAFVAATTLAGCSTMPAENATLDVARRDFAQSSADANVMRLAAPEMRQAGAALDRATNAWMDRSEVEQVERLAMIAKQRTEIAKEVAKRKLAEQQIASATRERDQLIIAQRTFEAEQARRAAQSAQQQTQAMSEQVQNAQARNRQLESELQGLAAKNTARGTIVTLGNLMFDTDSAQINPGGMLELRKVADALVDNPERTVMIEGFTDNTGSAEHNRMLSARRSDAIRSALVDMGVGAGRITTRGYGEAYPVASNSTTAGRQLNRRVEIVISDDRGRIAPRGVS
jgi:outer membrane protein OmpA-like peptidoglycan-associated protein